MYQESSMSVLLRESSIRFDREFFQARLFNVMDSSYKLLLVVIFWNKAANLAASVSTE